MFVLAVNLLTRQVTICDQCTQKRVDNWSTRYEEGN